MVKVTVLKAFGDLKEGVDRLAGDTFEATEERAAEIDARLPGFIEYTSGDVDYDSMKVAELKALCAERGIEVPNGTKKAELVELLKG